MKKLLFAFVFVFVASMAMAQVTVTFNNLTGVYYGVTFHTSSVSGTCPSTIASSIYIDVPYYQGRQTNALDEGGNTIGSVSNVTGITIWALSSSGLGSGTTYVYPFCSGGSPSTSGIIVNPGEAGSSGSAPATYYWTINTSTNSIQIVIL